MRRCAALVGIVLLSIVLSGCSTACTSGSEFEPPLCPSHIPEIQKVVIEKTGQSLSGWPQAETTECKDFTPTEGEVWSYLKQARETTAQGVHYTLPESPCFASGTLVFSNRDKAIWTMKGLGLGSVIFPDGAEKILYCPDC